MALIIYGASYVIRTVQPNALISLDFVTFCHVLRINILGWSHGYAIAIKPAKITK